MDIKNFRLNQGIIAFWLVLIILSVNACKVHQKTTLRSFEPQDSFINNLLFSKEFSGFTLYDIEKKSYLAKVNDSKHFTPASNTKIVTLYSSLMLLGDSLPVVRFYESDDTLFFGGTGNPLHLNPYFLNNKHLADFLKSKNKFLAYLPADPAPFKYGPGWAWDDAIYYFQLENNSLPCYGNELQIEIRNDSLFVTPEFFRDSISFTKGEKNTFAYTPGKNVYQITNNGSEWERVFPLTVSDKLVTAMLSDIVGRSVATISKQTDPRAWKYYKIPFPDSLYVRLMHQSDNFIAEQLLLMSALMLTDTMDRNKAIHAMKNEMSAWLTHDFKWVDGSGLSRYNLFTPGNMTEILNRIYELKGLDWISHVFPKGGTSGTIDSWYEPYVFAKTGTLSNNHCLSGYITAKSGKTYIFSFMHNHFLGSSKDYKVEMAKLLKNIYDHL